MQTELNDSTADDVLGTGATQFAVAEARELVAYFAKVTTSKDVDAFLAGFTDDCVVQYGEFQTVIGKKAFRPFVERMFSQKLKDFVCRKSLRSLNENVIGGTWTAEWTDADSGKRKLGRGFEFWIMRGRQIARWDAAFDFWSAQQQSRDA